MSRKGRKQNLGPFVDCGKEFKCHSVFSRKLVKGCNQGRDVMGFEFSLKDVKQTGLWPEK